MASNSFGDIFRITTFGESHGKLIGVVIDGCPSGITINETEIYRQLMRRKGGQTSFGTERTEEDKYEIVSGYFDNRTTGAPLTFIIHNRDIRSDDYISLEHTYRPSHADFTYSSKYGVRDYRGGGRSSARETTLWIIAGCVANQVLLPTKINITAYVSQIGPIGTAKSYTMLDLNTIDSNIVRCPDADVAKEMIELLGKIKNDGDSTGGIITCVIRNMKSGMGDPIFAKLQSKLAAAMLSINAVHGFEYGSGFGGAAMKGSDHNDIIENIESGQKKSLTLTNNSGGIQGGISNGMDIYFRVAFKPISSIKMEQPTVNAQNQKTTVTIGGRHDACVVPRAVPIVEALTTLVLTDAYMLQKAYQEE